MFVFVGVRLGPRLKVTVGEERVEHQDQNADQNREHEDHIPFTFDLNSTDMQGRSEGVKD